MDFSGIASLENQFPETPLTWILCLSWEPSVYDVEVTKMPGIRSQILRFDGLDQHHGGHMKAMSQIVR